MDENRLIRWIKVVKARKEGQWSLVTQPSDKDP